jgi:hypothetical protein
MKITNIGATDIHIPVVEGADIRLITVAPEAVVEVPTAVAEAYLRYYTGILAPAGKTVEVETEAETEDTPAGKKAGKNT